MILTVGSSTNVSQEPAGSEDNLGIFFSSLVVLLDSAFGFWERIPFLHFWGSADGRPRPPLCVLGPGPSFALAVQRIPSLIIEIVLMSSLELGVMVSQQPLLNPELCQVPRSPFINSFQLSTVIISININILCFLLGFLWGGANAPGKTQMVSTNS